MKLRLLVFLAALIVTFSMLSDVSSPANAQSLEDLRVSGAVGERFDGYVAVRNPDAKIFADQVNAKRQQIYEGRAAAQGVSADQVGRVYAQELLKRLPSDTWF